MAQYNYYQDYIPSSMGYDIAVVLRKMIYITVPSQHYCILLYSTAGVDFNMRRVSLSDCRIIVTLIMYCTKKQLTFIRILTGDTGSYAVPFGDRFSLWLIKVYHIVTPWRIPIQDSYTSNSVHWNAHSNLIWK